MSIPKALLLLVSHGACAAVGFAAGIYALPILIAPASPTAADLSAATGKLRYSAEFSRNLKGSDALHWGEGTVAIGEHSISLMGELAPGPDYKLYLSPEFVETEPEFLAIKSQMQLVGDVRTFRNFLLPIPAGVDPAQYNSLIVWCEAFGEFISAAQYQDKAQ